MPLGGNAADFSWDGLHVAMLYVFHVIREGDVLRLISARRAEPAERRCYEND